MRLTLTLALASRDRRSGSCNLQWPDQVNDRPTCCRLRSIADSIHSSIVTFYYIIIITEHFFFASVIVYERRAYLVDLRSRPREILSLERNELARVRKRSGVFLGRWKRDTKSRYKGKKTTNSIVFVSRFCRTAH